ncbi:MAG: hypothetical protein ACLR23_14480 [Clostridia bacterium]
MNMGGIGTAVNLPKAKRYFEKSGETMDQPPTCPIWPRQTVPAERLRAYYDPNKAVDCLLQAAQKGHESFQRMLLASCFSRAMKYRKMWAAHCSG